MRKHLPFILVIVGLLIMILGTGCGGGGGGGTGNGGGNGGALVDPEVVAVSNGNFVDTRNLRPGQTVELKILGFDSTGKPVLTDGTNWRTNAPATVARVTAAGEVTAVGANAGTFTVTGTYRGTSYSEPFGVRSNIAIVTGQVRTVGGNPVGYGEILFYNNTGGLVGETRVNADGTYRAQVPATATRFVWDNRDISDKFLAQYIYSGSEYSVDIDGCWARLPTLTANQTYELVDIVVRAKVAGSPPPPPPGCWQD